jgi:hypothetical protein
MKSNHTEYTAKNVTEGTPKKKKAAGKEMTRGGAITTQSRGPQE